MCLLYLIVLNICNMEFEDFVFVYEGFFIFYFKFMDYVYFCWCFCDVFDFVEVVVVVCRFFDEDVGFVIDEVIIIYLGYL